jgi:transposase InsO family protein
MAPAPDRLERNFTATGPDQRWCADITYVETREGYLFLAVVTRRLLAPHRGVVDARQPRGRAQQPTAKDARLDDPSRA